MLTKLIGALIVAIAAAATTDILITDPSPKLEIVYKNGAESNGSMFTFEPGTTVYFDSPTLGRILEVDMRAGTFKLSDGVSKDAATREFIRMLGQEFTNMECKEKPKPQTGKKPCPCAAMQNCKCDYETGSYSFSDGCNSSSCDAHGNCLTTLMYCAKDWRD